MRPSIALTTVFPNTGILKQCFKAYGNSDFCFQAVFACHHSVDPLGVGMDVLGKFGADIKYVSEIGFLVDLPKNALRKYDMVAYLFFPKAAAKGSFEKSVVIKHCHQTLPKVLLK